MHPSQRLDVMMTTAFLEIDCASLPVGQPAIVQELQQDIQDVRMRLFDLVEQNDRIQDAAAPLL